VKSLRRISHLANIKEITTEITFIAKHTKKNPQNNPVIILRGLFEMQMFFNCNTPSIPSAVTDTKVHMPSGSNLMGSKNQQKINPRKYPINSPVQRAQTGN